MLRNMLTLVALSPLLVILSALFIYPAISGTTTVAIRSTSMQPTIPISALVYIKKQSEYAVGDVVTFRAGSENYTHRLTDTAIVGGDRLWETRGDANSGPDAQPLHNDNILGKAQFYVPYMGFVSLIAGEPAVMAFIGLLTLIVLFWPIIWGETEKNPLQRTTIAEGK